MTATPSGPRSSAGEPGPEEPDAALPILALGTLTLDTVETPDGRSDGAPGGSALYFAAAAGLLAPVRVLGVVGDDFPGDALDRLRARGADTRGVARRAGATMSWHARYGPGMEERTTLAADRGVLERWSPEVPAAWRQTPIVFLGSTDPRLQAAVLEEARAAARLVVADSMAHWIRDRRSEVEEVAGRADVFLASEEECRLLGDDDRTEEAAARIRDLGPRWVVVKRGPRGATLLGEDDDLAMPAYPVSDVVDPTGAGDAFAGGLVGWLAREREPEPDARTLLRALAAGAAAASFAVADFSVRGLEAADRDSLLERLERIEAAGAY